MTKTFSDSLREHGFITDPPAPEPRGPALSPATPRYVTKALELEAAGVREAPEGTRNDRLNKAAFSLGQLVAGAGLDRNVVEAELHAAALLAGLDNAESIRTIRSGLDAGAKQPRGPQPVPGDRRPVPAFDATDDPRRTHWTAVDLMGTTFPEPRYAVPGLLAEGLNLLAGSPKVGKSWLALGLGIAVASGGRALGSVQVDRGDVVFLGLEDTPRRLQSRLRSVLQGAPAPTGLNFATEWKPMPDGGADDLDAALSKRPDCRLVIVDVLAKVRGRVDDRGARYDQDYAAVSALKAVADAHSVAVLVLHHVRKAHSEDFLDTVSGTHGLAGAADAVLVMQRARNSAEARLHITGRDVEESTRALEFDAKVGTWALLDGPASDYDVSPERRQILEVVRAETALRPKQIAEKTGLSHDVVKQLVRKLADAGQLDTDGAGLYYAVIHPLTPFTPFTEDEQEVNAVNRVNGVTP